MSFLGNFEDMQRPIHNISIIGSGNVATVLGRILFRHGFVINQIVSRNPVAGKKLADELHANYVDFSGRFHPESDLYIIALSDSAILSCLSFLSGFEKMVVHTAASVPMEVLKEVSNEYGVIYPLQSLNKESKEVPGIPFFYSSNNIENEEIIKSTLLKISNKVTKASNEERLKYHVAAVMVCNFTNHFYALAEAFCKRESLDFSNLIPLIEETAFRVRNTSPALLQTGPAVRKDDITMGKHIDLLKKDQGLQSLYKAISQSIIEFNDRLTDKEK